jgi:hypothetical protein
MQRPFNFTPSPAAQEPQTQWLFIDEAGDPTLFSGKGQPLVGSPGCSRYFILGKLEVEDPLALSQALTALRQEMITDPYFAGVPSFDPTRPKTAIQFHAKNDLPEVRYQVLKQLAQYGSALRFHAVVADKQTLLKREMSKREQAPGYRYQPDAIYDSLMQSLFAKFHRLADAYEVCIARRGKKDRNQAIMGALQAAEREFEQKFSLSRGDNWNIVISDPKQTIGLQAVDYFLWAVQRFYEGRVHPQTGEEIREDRFLRMLWPQIAEIHDLDFGPQWGTFFTNQNPLTVATRFGEQGAKKKKS